MTPAPPTHASGAIPPPPGAPLPPTTPTPPQAVGPSFNLSQSGQFVGVTNNQYTLGGQLRLDANSLSGGGRRITGTIDCVNGGQQRKLDAIVRIGAKTWLAGTLGGVAFAADLKRDPPAPGTSLHGRRAGSAARTPRRRGRPVSAGASC